MKYRIEHWAPINNPLLGDKAEMHIISSDSVTVGKAVFKEPMALMEHSHLNEQVTIVLNGEMEIILRGEKKLVKKGQACIIPSNEQHTVTITKTPFESFDVFTPIREDYVKDALTQPKKNHHSI